MAFGMSIPWKSICERSPVWLVNMLSHSVARIGRLPDCGMTWINIRRASSNYIARAVGESIFTEAGDLEALRRQVRNAVRGRFDEGKTPPNI